MSLSKSLPIAAFALAFSMQARSADLVEGLIMVVKGKVEVIAAKDKKVYQAKVGSKVQEGDSIKTGADSRAKITMADKNILNVSPDSFVTIEKYRNDLQSGKKNVELRVLEGKLRANVEQKYDESKNTFHVKTPTAVAGVRGTDFITGFDKRSRVTSIVTFSGVVAVGSLDSSGRVANPVMVNPGESTKMENGKAPEPPKAIPQDQLLKMNTESKTDSSADSKNRTPNSAGGESMVTTKDLGAEVAKDVNFPAGPQAGPNFNPNGNMGPQIPRNPFVDGATQNGKAKAIIVIQNGN